MPTRAELDESHFSIADEGTKDIQAGEENTIGEFTVPAQETYRWGYGRTDSINQGYAYADIRNEDDEEVHGDFWFVQIDATGDNRMVVERVNVDSLRGDKYDKELQLPLPEQTNYPEVGENSRLRLVFVPREDETVDYDNSEVRLPTSRRKVGGM